MKKIPPLYVALLELIFQVCGWMRDNEAHLWNDAAATLTAMHGYDGYVKAAEGVH